MVNQHPIRSITVCVGYDDLLQITLPRNVRHLSHTLVVTHESDTRTISLAGTIPNVSVFTTNAFYENGAKFNKGLAIEQAFDVIGRSGWLLVWDADILFPDKMPLPPLKVGNLYTPYRVTLEDPRRWSPKFSWKRAKRENDSGFVGYFQLFHADDQVLQSTPWYGTDWTHCGGGDDVFQAKWSSNHKIRPDFKVLHLGPRDTNWFGRVSPRRDGQPLDGTAVESQEQMEQFLRFKGWRRPKTVKEFEEKVNRR